GRHEGLIHRIVRDGRMIPLRRLLRLDQYPSDVMALYVEGYSLTHFLVGKRDRKTFLAFVKEGAEDDWDTALKTHYGYEKVEDLETAWLTHLRQLERARDARTRLSARHARPQLCALRERP